MDLSLGSIFELNEIAAFVWEHTLDGVGTDRIAKELASIYAIPEQLAHDDVTRTLNATEEAYSAEPASEVESYAYRLVDTTYRFLVRGVETFELASNGQAIRLSVDRGTSSLYNSLRALSPKILALQGVSVLHAAAVAWPDGGVLAFVGESGAGKTSTARAFQACGATLVSEDKLIMRSEPDASFGLLTGEGTLESALEKLYSQLTCQDEGHWCDIRSLAEVTNGVGRDVDKVFALDKGNRVGRAFATVRLSEQGAVSTILKNTFYGSAEPGAWKRQFARSANLAAGTPIYSLMVPNGLDALISAAAAYSDTIRS